MTDPDGDASNWTLTRHRRHAHYIRVGWPGPFGGLVTVGFVGTVGLNTLRIDLVDSDGVPSVPVMRFGPSPTCGGQILQILG